MKIKVKKVNSDAKLPEYSRVGDAGMDIFSCEDYELMPGDKHIFGSGIAVEYPTDHLAYIYDKSGLSCKHELITLGGVMDPNYRGEWQITIKNIGNKSYKIEKGEKICQVVFHKISQVEVEEVNELSTDSARGDNWAGSSGRS